MAALYPLTLDAWNSVISQINQLAANPPDGCDPLESLSPVFTPHKWTVQDIEAAQNKLTEICSDNSFTTPIPGSKWQTVYLDELWDAIESGWCNCEPEIPCCIPVGNGTYWQVAYGTGYWVTCPYWQIIEQYLYANIDYSTAAAALPDGVMAHLVECYPGSSAFVSLSLTHSHWGNCIYQDYWVEGGKKGDEYQYLCGEDPDEVNYLGRLPAIESRYPSSTSTSGPNYYGAPVYCSGWQYDYIEGRWYQSCQIGYQEYDGYYYSFAYWDQFICR